MTQLSDDPRVKRVSRASELSLSFFISIATWSHLARYSSSGFHKRCSKLR
jgi:hypothetical protein